jgi:hypothetical protein
VRYTIDYFLFDYYPEIRTIEWGGIQANWGHIFAYYRTSKAKLSFPGFQFTEQRNKFLICDVTSEYIANEDGAWEKPNDYPDNPNYGGYAEAPPSEGTQLLERQHRAWFIIPSGMLRYEDFNRSTLQPYENSSSYRPEYKFTIHQPPDEQWALDAYNRVNFQNIRKEVSVRYGI